MSTNEIHPDLAALFAAGDAVLPDHLIDGTADPPSTTNASPADRKGATTTAGASGERQNEATSFWHLGNLLTELFRHALEKSNAVESNPQVPPRNGSAGGGGEGESDDDSGVRAPTQLATVALGESISWGNGTMYNPARPSDPEDISLMMLGAHDFPAMRPKGLNFKLGNKLVSPGTPDAEFVADRHRPFCDSLLEISTELTDFWGAAPAMEDAVPKHTIDGGFPMYVRDLRYVFESADAASLYYKRSWRYLTENWVMNLPPPSGDDGVRACPPTEILYTRCVKERLLLADTIGAESVCFKTPDDGHPNAIRGKEGVALGASIIVVFRVGSVVAKTYIAARDRHIPTDIVQRGLRNAAARIETWCAAKSTPTVLRELPPDVRSFREEFMSEWRDCIEQILTWPKPRKSIEYGEAPCQVCQKHGSHKRCSGCRGFTYCGAVCQKKHWIHGHKQDCTSEFTALSTDFARRTKRVNSATISEDV